MAKSIPLPSFGNTSMITTALILNLEGYRAEAACSVAGALDCLRDLRLGVLNR